MSEHHRLACLELALRERLKEEIRIGKIKEKRPTLHPLLKYAVAHGLVRNEGFSAWQNRGEIRSRARVEMEKLREASEKNLTEITWDESNVHITAEDLDWDYVKMLPGTSHGQERLCTRQHGAAQLGPAFISDCQRDHQSALSGARVVRAALLIIARSCREAAAGAT